MIRIKAGDFFAKPGGRGIAHQFVNDGTGKFTEVEDRYAGYTVYDQHYEKIGNADDLFLDESDQPEHRRGSFGRPVPTLVR